MASSSPFEKIINNKFKQIDQIKWDTLKHNWDKILSSPVQLQS